MSEVTYEFVSPEDPRFEQVRRLRHDTLRAPLGIDYEPDWDDADPASSHLIASIDGEVVGYGRVIVRPDGGQIRHMCVSDAARGAGVGSGLVRVLTERAHRRGAKLVWLNARFSALDFYRRLGFESVGPFFDSEETHIPHRRMELR